MNLMKIQDNSKVPGAAAETSDKSSISHRMEASVSASASSVSTSSHRPSNRSTATLRPTTNSTDGFTLQRLTLDSAVAPLLTRPTAPFCKSERKRAHTSAVYYSECFLQGIAPIVADTAAKDAQGKYDKWWVKATHHHHPPPTITTTPTPAASSVMSLHQQPPRGVGGHVSKRRKKNNDRLDKSSVTSANVVSISSSAAATSLYNDHFGGLTSEDESIEEAKRPSQSLLQQDEEEETVVAIQNISTLSLATTNASQIRDVKHRLIANLKASGGSTETPEFLGYLEFLETYYRSKSWDGRESSTASRNGGVRLEGNWLTLNKSTYDECKGLNAKGEYQYGLGRMSFDMFRPTNLTCTINANFNSVRPMDPKNPDRPLHVPRRLLKDLQAGNVNLRTYEYVYRF
jgi:hypothetical protein